jgi:uncharacterized protein
MTTVTVTVAWATPTAQDLVPVALPAGATVGAAIEASGLRARYAIGADAKVGINGRLAHHETVLADGDRVEIYRPLTVDPKEARRARARTKPLPKNRSTTKNN